MPGRDIGLLAAGYRLPVKDIFSHEEFLKDNLIGESLEKDGIIIIDSCATGEGEEGAENIVNMIARLFPQALRIYSPCRYMYGMALEYNVDNTIKEIYWVGGVRNYDPLALSNLQSIACKKEADGGRIEGTASIAEEDIISKLLAGELSFKDFSPSDFDKNFGIRRHLAKLYCDSKDPDVRLLIYELANPIGFDENFEESEALKDEIFEMVNGYSRIPKRKAKWTDIFKRILKKNLKVPETKIYVEGNVIGVGFRSFVEELPDKLWLDIEVHAENLPDGRVEITVTGSDKEIKKLVSYLPSPDVTRITVKPEGKPENLVLEVSDDFKNSWASIKNNLEKIMPKEVSFDVRVRLYKLRGAFSMSLDEETGEWVKTKIRDNLIIDEGIDEVMADRLIEEAIALDCAQKLAAPFEKLLPGKGPEGGFDKKESGIEDIDENRDGGEVFPREVLSSSIGLSTQLNSFYEDCLFFDIEANPIFANAKSMGSRGQINQRFGTNQRIRQMGTTYKFSADSFLVRGSEFFEIPFAFWSKFYRKHINVIYLSPKLFWIFEKDIQPFRLASSIASLSDWTYFGLSGSFASISSINHPAGFAVFVLYSLSVRRSTNASSITDRMSRKAGVSNINSWGVPFLSTIMPAREFLLSLNFGIDLPQAANLAPLSPLSANLFLLPFINISSFPINNTVFSQKSQNEFIIILKDGGRIEGAASIAGFDIIPHSDGRIYYIYPLSGISFRRLKYAYVVFKVDEDKGLVEIIDIKKVFSGVKGFGKRTVNDILNAYPETKKIRIKNIISVDGLKFALSLGATEKLVIKVLASFSVDELLIGNSDDKRDTRLQIRGQMLSVAEEDILDGGRKELMVGKAGAIGNSQEFDGGVKPLVLVILDGWGINSEIEGNAIAQANTPVMDSLIEKYPNTLLDASGPAVGLPFNHKKGKPEMGNSEVGHLNLGAGRKVWQDVCAVNKSIEDKTFFSNQALLETVNHLKSNPGSNLHIMGLISDAVIHSSAEHLYNLLQFFKEEKVENVYIHAITDGRDSGKTSGVQWIKKLEEKIDDIGVGVIATLAGRIFPMDRDKDWGKVRIGYDLYTEGKGNKRKDALSALEEFYNKKDYENFIKVKKLF